MNSVSLIGRLCADPDFKISQSGKAVCRIRLAVQRGFKNAQGNYESDFINCMAFGKTAEIANQYAKKGDQIGLTGRIQTGSYTTQQGEKKYTFDIMVDRLALLGGKKENKPEAKPEPEQMSIDPFQEFGDLVEIDDNFLD